MGGLQQPGARAVSRSAAPDADCWSDTGHVSSCLVACEFVSCLHVPMTGSMSRTLLHVRGVIRFGEVKALRESWLDIVLVLGIELTSHLLVEALDAQWA